MDSVRTLRAERLPEARVATEGGGGASATATALRPLVPEAPLTATSVARELRYLRRKRLIDVVGASLLLLVLALPMLVVALLIRLTSKGPAIFTQERMGIGQRRFRMYKFRTMCVDAEARRSELEPLNEMDGPVFKIRSDPRVTRVGRLLRRYSLDELPQLVNVLRGEMSLVGPRPPLPSEVARYEPWQLRRLGVVPGLTCLWQVSGRNDLGFDDWMRLDLEYIERRSTRLDLELMARTIPAVIFARGAS